MEEKLLVTLRRLADAETVRQSGATELAAYPDTVLVRATAKQRAFIERAGIEVAPVTQAPLRTIGTAFSFGVAVAANAAEPLPLDPNRTAYFLVQLIGPARSEWLAELRAMGATIQASQPGFTLLVGLLPGREADVRALGWVEDITPYRAAMKISPALRPASGRILDVAALLGVNLAPNRPADLVRVEVSAFAGESIAEIAGTVRAEGGQVLTETQQAVIAVIPRAAILPLAREQAVQAILPHSIPELHNDRSAKILGLPPNRLFGDLALTGAGQIIAVADGGLDTGDAATIHPDFRDRIKQLVSLPVAAHYLPYMDDPSQMDSGAADVFTGHGTHVAGSVLGSGGAAIEHGNALVPRGIAPEAHLFFQAIEQTVAWKDRDKLEAAGLLRPDQAWPLKRVGLYGNPEDPAELFEPAYAAGARIHSNSWGSSARDESGVYNGKAAGVDAFLWTHRDMLAVFSAGNSGEDKQGGESATGESAGDGIVDPDSIGPPATAKNCLTVGASEGRRPDLGGKWSQDPRFPLLTDAGGVADNPDGMAAFSSRGPTDDGRIKPDVVAPGTIIVSVRSSAYDNPDDPTPLAGELPTDHPLRGLYCFASGTSMAAPLVAGAVALIRQYLVQERGHLLGGVKPSGALLKALVVNGAVPLPGQFPGEIPDGPNSVAGFGRVNVKESLGLDGAPPVFFVDEPDLAVETGEIRTFGIEAVDPSRPLKVTLVWTDAPGAPGQGTLCNKLYLQVVEPVGAVLNGDPGPVDEPQNNVQQVTVPQPVAGTYEVRVRGTNVTMQLPTLSPDETFRQDFALAASNARTAALELDVTLPSEGPRG